MWFTVLDDMGNPHQINSHYGIGRNVVGTLPLPAKQVGPTGNYTDAPSLNTQANGLLELSNLHNTLLTNNQLVASGTGDDVAAQNPNHVVKRPWLEEPEGGVPFDPQTSAALG